MSDTLTTLRIGVDPTGGVNGLRHFRAGLRRTRSHVLALTSSIVSTTSKIALMTAGFVGITSAMGALGIGFRSARRHWEAMAEVSTLVAGTTAEISYLNQASSELLQTFGGNTTEILKGFYQSISAGVGDVVDAANFMKTALGLAVGGVTDTITAVTALSSVTNAYKHVNYEASRAADVLFTTVRLGMTTIGELGGQIGRVTSLAAPLGIQFEEVAAAVAVLTGKAGLSTRMAITAFRGALTAMVKPANEVHVVLKDLERQTGVLGLEFTASNLEARGFIGMLEQLRQATGGNKDLLTEIFPNIEAMQAMFPLLTTQFEAFKSALDSMYNDSAGAAAAAFAKIEKSLPFRFDRELSKISDNFKSMGHSILAFLTPVLESINAGISAAFNTTDITIKFHDFLWNVAISAAELAEALKGPVNVVIGGIQRVIDFYNTLPGWLKTWGILGAIVLGRKGIAAATTGGIIYDQGTKLVEKSLKSTIDEHYASILPKEGNECERRGCLGYCGGYQGCLQLGHRTG